MHKKIKQVNCWKIYQVSDYPNKFTAEFDGKILEEFRCLSDCELFCKGTKTPKQAGFVK